MKATKQKHIYREIIRSNNYNPWMPKSKNVTRYHRHLFLLSMTSPTINVHIRGRSLTIISVPCYNTIIFEKLGSHAAGKFTGSNVHPSISISAAIINT